MPYSKETIRAHGQILADFANAENTDEACFGYFKNIQNFLGFSPDFDKQIKKNFPFMRSFAESMNETEKKLLELIIEEKLKLSLLDKQFEMIGYTLESYDSQNKNLSLSQIHLEGGLFNGEPDFTVTTEGPHPYSFEELKGDIEGSLHPDVPNHINELMKIGQSIHDLKSKIQNNRFEEIYEISKQYKKILELHDQIKKIQKDYRNILEMIIEGAPLDEISPLARKFKTIYDVSMMTTTKISGDFFEETPLIDETNYVRNKINRGWFIELQNEFVYWMVEFLKGEGNKKYLKKCHQCKAFYASKTLAPSKYCSDKCRMTFHNRKRIESGEHRRYKRDRIASGKATPSYFGPDPNKGKRKLKGKRK